MGYVISFQDGPYCWNCELADYADFNTVPHPDHPMHFCCPDCQQDWETSQPLLNFLDKRKAKRARGMKCD